MLIAADKIKKTCKKNSLKLQEALDKAGVSKTAYYSLVRRGLVVPQSILQLCAVLEVTPLELLEDISLAEIKTRERFKELDRILKKNPTIDRDNAWQTLILLDETPEERLNRSLMRGRKFNFYS